MLGQYSPHSFCVYGLAKHIAHKQGISRTSVTRVLFFCFHDELDQLFGRSFWTRLRRCLLGKKPRILSGYRALWKSRRVEAAIAIADFRMRLGAMTRVLSPITRRSVVDRGGHFFLPLVSTNNCCLSSKTSATRPMAPPALGRPSNKQVRSNIFFPISTIEPIVAIFQIFTRLPQTLDLWYFQELKEAQGKTADRALILVDSAISREGLYVAVSRAKHDVKLYATSTKDLEIAGANIREKSSALDQELRHSPRMTLK